MINREPTGIEAARFLNLYRIEVATSAALALLVTALTLGVGWRLAAIFVGGLLCSTAAWPQARHASTSWIKRSAGRRRAIRTFEASSPGRLSKRPPRVACSTADGNNTVFDLRFKRGTSFDDLEPLAEMIASSFRAHSCSVERNPGSADRAVLTITQTDPFVETVAATLPELTSILVDRVDLGIDNRGYRVSVSLAGRHVLIGGEPGAGKSTAMDMLLAACALDPRCRIFGIDPKLVELGKWRPVLNGLVGPDIVGATGLLAEVTGLMNDRFAAMASNGRRTVGSESGAIVVFVDELAFFAEAGTKTSRADFFAELRGLVSRGRGAGIIVVAATQKPSTDSIPSGIRDLMGIRLALRCNTRDASDTILGRGQGKAGADASLIRPDQPGVAVLTGENSGIARLRISQLSPSQIELAVSRGLEARQKGAPNDDRAV